MTTIALFGASGRLGGRVLTQALAEGHHVHVLVRDPDRIEDRSRRLTITAGGMQDLDAIAQVIEGAEVVISLIGQSPGSSRTFKSDATAAIIRAMQVHGVHRLFTMSGVEVADEHDRPKIADRLLIAASRMTSPFVLADDVQHVGLLRDSGLEWTVIRSPRLTEEPGRGRYRVGWVGVNNSQRISRDDLALFVVDQIDDREFVRQMPFVSE